MLNTLIVVLPGESALPGGNLFALLVLLVLGQIAGYFVNRVLKGPELLGKYKFKYPSRSQPTRPGCLRYAARYASVLSPIETCLMSFTGFIG